MAQTVECKVCGFHTKMVQEGICTSCKGMSIRFREVPFENKMKMLKYLVDSISLEEARGSISHH